MESGLSESRGVVDVLLTGATGLVGGALLERLRDRGARVRTLSRSGRAPAPSVEALRWDGVDPGAEALAGVRAVVHLAGEPIFGGLPTPARLARVRASRIDSTRRFVERIAEQPPDERPARFLCASAVGIYGARGSEPLDEQSSIGTGFLAEVCRDWEAAANEAGELGVDVLCVRIGVVLSREGGALALMRVPFQLGVGGRLGDGRQFFPWIHLDDLVSVLLWGLDGDATGVVNAVAPEAVRNAELTRALAKVLNRPAFFPVPAFVLRKLMGEVAGELVDSRMVVPSRLAEAGFSFAYPSLVAALEQELGSR